MAFARSASAVLATAALYFFGTGLTPVPWLTWLAPLPILLLASRVPARSAAVAAFAAYSLGGANTWRYYAVDLELPVPLLAIPVLLFPLLLTGVVLLFRAVLLRGQALLAAVAFPAGIAAAEYLVCLATPAGANWSLAPTQSDLLPVLQVAAVTGGWGVSFLVSSLPAALAVARPRVAAAGFLVVGLAVGLGALRLATVDERSSPRITLLSARTDRDEVRVDTRAGRDLVAAYVDWLRTAPDDGTRIVVLPEKGFRADEATLPALIDPLVEAARTRGVDLVVGVTVTTGERTHNAAYHLSKRTVVYRKHHLVPGLEDALTAGTDLAFAPDGRVGIAICADLGHPEFGRAYGRAGAGLLLVPALDFTVDAWSQSRVQALRGVESGFSVARAARLGYLTLSDHTGRVVAQAATGSATPFTAVSGTLPVADGPTPYARWGDWFAWLCLVVVVVASWSSRSRKDSSEKDGEGTLTRSAG
ncbi:nitrilase-related carbon-nitrogen hydrolase [Umezawaea endophytica]|uniref:Acyltransferase n=1 Tax=Umezawaea endophytica TaxID=1654476 RepID=A0A9X3AIX7_9PSEU|nr:nitrilase-related carbon-nitrogen hydrolase [Umezawaea endophytica]MCS7481155.1 acyltransferase [Umezawaea endophytica]